MQEIKQLNPDTPHLQDRIYDTNGIAPCVAKGNGYNSGIAAILTENAVAFCQNQVGDVLTTEEEMHCLNTNSNATGRNAANVLVKRRVRRLTPTEFARLQGFPDSHAKIDGASDAKQYAAYGNSMTVNVMRWLGKRIKAVDDILLDL